MLKEIVIDETGETKEVTLVFTGADLEKLTELEFLILKEILERLNEN